MADLPGENAGAQISAFRKKVNDALTEVVLSSVEDLAHEANRKINNKTGYLRASLRVQHGEHLGADVQTQARPSRDEKLAAGARGHPSIRAALSNWRGSDIRLLWTAYYGRFLEAGRKGAKARPFARAAAKAGRRLSSGMSSG